MSKRKVLVVDDEAGFGELLALNLEQTGQYEVRTETKGGRALESVRSFGPDLILLDVIMPELGGMDIAQELIADPQLNSIPVIFLTATVSREDVVDHQELLLGRPVLAKPPTMPEVIQCIEAQFAETSS